MVFPQDKTDIVVHHAKLHRAYEVFSYKIRRENIGDGVVNMFLIFNLDLATPPSDLLPKGAFHVLS